MNRYARAGLTASMLSLSLLLAACGTFDPSSFDPTSIFDLEIFNTKKKLPGKREPVFPEGTPGVPQGVPPELVKGYHVPEPTDAAQQAANSAPEAAPEAKVEAKPKPKPRPKPKLVAKPPDDSTPTAVTVRPSAAPPPAQSQPTQSQQVQWPAPPPTQPQAQQPAAAWPGAPASAGAVAWPDPPATTPR